jgi:hypothetical protein
LFALITGVRELEHENIAMTPRACQREFIARRLPKIGGTQVAATEWARDMCDQTDCEAVEAGRIYGGVWRLSETFRAGGLAFGFGVFATPYCYTHWINLFFVRKRKRPSHEARPALIH